MGLILTSFKEWKPPPLHVNFSHIRLPSINKTTGSPKAYDNDIRKILTDYSVRNKHK